MIPAVSVPEGTSGVWRVERFTVAEDSFERMRLAMQGRGLPPGEYTRLMRGRTVVMSDTSAEKRDHYAAVHHAKGRCLLNGLGLGMVLNAMLLKPSVEHVTVIEKSEDVVALVGPTYASSRVSIIQADAFEYKPPKGARFGVVWHDIWDDICADNLPEMHKLHRKYGRFADWQGSWGRDTIESMERRERRRRYWL